MSEKNNRRDLIMSLMRKFAIALMVIIIGSTGLYVSSAAYAETENDDYIRTIRYSNAYDQGVRKEIVKELKKAGIPKKDIDCFTWNVRDYNRTIKGTGLVKKGYKKTKKLIPTYDVDKLDSLWLKKYDSFIGNNCRITAFGLMHSKITVKKKVKDKYMTLFMDEASLDDNPKTVLTGKEKKKFMSFYAPIPAKDSTDTKVQVKQIKKYLKSRGVKFKKGKASLISVYMHTNFSKDENYLFIGHTGVLIRLSSKKYMFIEKISFQEPYQALIFDSKAHLNDYLMNRYDVEYDQGIARPIIFENGSLLEGYRYNPNNNQTYIP